MNRLIRQLLPFASLFLVILILSIKSPGHFLTLDNWLNVLRRSSVNSIMAVGMTAIIISGGIDLSVGSMLALAGMAGAWTMLHFGGGVTASGMWLGTLVGALVGAACGLLNGLLITRLKLPPFIVTLGTMSTFRGISYLMNRGGAYNVSEYVFLGDGELFHAPVSVVMAIVIILLAVVVLRYTRLGRYMYAIGANRDAAFYSGVNVERNLTAVYTLAGLLVGISAMVATSRVVSAQPTAGNGLELDIIAAVVIGGASLSGGRGTILGTIIGTLLIGFLRNGCTLLGIQTDAQLIVIGVTIIVAVSVDQMGRERAE